MFILIGFENRRELHLSCGLVNIARGNCTILMRPEANKVKGEILISSERPVMNHRKHTSFSSFCGHKRSPLRPRIHK